MDWKAIIAALILASALVAFNYFDSQYSNSTKPRGSSQIQPDSGSLIKGQASDSTNVDVSIVRRTEQQQKPLAVLEDQEKQLIRHIGPDIDASSEGFVSLSDNRILHLGSEQSAVNNYRHALDSAEYQNIGEDIDADSIAQLQGDDQGNIQIGDYLIVDDERFSQESTKTVNLGEHILIESNQV